MGVGHVWWPRAPRARNPTRFTVLVHCLESLVLSGQGAHVSIFTGPTKSVSGPAWVGSWLETEHFRQRAGQDKPGAREMSLGDESGSGSPRIQTPVLELLGPWS
jgi:hypothetical protein